MSSQLAVKTNFGGDIRRFSISARTPFKLIEESIGRFYNLDLGFFKMSFLDGEGLLTTLTEETYRSLFTDYAHDPEKRILRLHIQPIFPEEKKAEEPIPEESSSNIVTIPENTSKTVQTESVESPSTSELDVVALFENPQFEEKLNYLMTEAMASKTLMELVKEGFVPSMINQMKEIAIRDKANPKVVETEEIPAKEEKEIKQPVPDNQVEIEPVPLSKDETEEQQINEEVKQFVVMEDTTQETQPEVENSGSNVEENQDPLQQVVESPGLGIESPAELIEKPSSLIPNVPPEVSSSPIKSFIYSLFKPIPKEPENLEEVLEKLAAMGFTDREANIEAIKFHNKFNEGLDAIVEDLLIQSALNESKKSSTQN